MTSHGSATMTSLTDHSIESILRHRGDVTGSREASLTNDGVCSSSSGGSGGSKPRLVLECRDLWHQFYSLSTEMVITKSGRRMFPALKLRVRGLQANVQYVIMLDIIPVDCYRYKYQDNRWVIAGKADQPVIGRQIHVHPDSPASGQHWMSRTLSFHKLKLTNNVVDKHGHIILNSMHRYQPRIYVVESGRDVSNTSPMTSSEVAGLSTFVFAETQFIAVTAYQNDKITKLKIDNNPFAKGFRDTGAGSCEKKRQQLKHSTSARLLTDSVSSMSSCNSPDDVINRCLTNTSDVSSQRTDDVTVTADTAVPTLCFGTEPLPTDGTVPEAPLDFRSMLVGAALARQQMMTSLSRHNYQSDYYSSYPYYHSRHSRRFTPYVITNDFVPTCFKPE